jgi:hypothetical protein
LRLRLHMPSKNSSQVSISFKVMKALFESLACEQRGAAWRCPSDLRRVSPMRNGKYASQTRIPYPEYSHLVCASITQPTCRPERLLQTGNGSEIGHLHMGNYFADGDRDLRKGQR